MRIEISPNAKRHILDALRVVGALLVVLTIVFWSNQTTVKAAQKQTTTVQEQVNAELAAIPQNVASQITSQAVTPLSNQMATLTGQLTEQTLAVQSTNRNVTALTNQLATANGQITALTTQLNTTSAKLTELQTNTASDRATVTALQKTIADLQAQITDVKKTSSTPTPTMGMAGTGNIGSSHTLQNVTATLSGMYGGFGGTPLLTFNVPTPTGGGVSSVMITNGGIGFTPNTTVQFQIVGSGGQSATGYAQTNATGTITAPIVINYQGYGYVSGGTVALMGGNGNGAMGIVTTNALMAGTTTQTLTLTVTNANTVTTNNVQLALGLALVDSNGNPLPTPPTWVSPQNITVSSGGFGTGWTFQSVVSPNIWTFTNVASSNPFGMGAVNLAPGQTQTLTQTIQVSNSMGGIGGILYLYPIIRVLSFTG